MTKSIPSIRQLSPSVINKIAAGEVIERPASVLKELLENAVDAGSDRIEAHLDKGGCDRIRVSDNGCGIASHQLPLALASHATSKIQTADDLFAVDTLGFRGEALASIAEVSQLCLRSRVADAQAGHELTVNGGLYGEVAPCACSPGTTVEVKNLFFNTPVRRKFLRTIPTELGHATEAFIRVSLAYPQVRFALKHNERLIHELSPVGNWQDRIAELFGRELTQNLMWVESQESNVRLSGFVANPTQSRSNNRMQYLFLNGRHIRDRSLQHALGESYRGLLLTGRFPIAFLNLELPPEQIDVNVHPTKLEVRFQDSGRVYSQLLSMIRGEFLATDLTARVQPISEPENAAPAQTDESISVRSGTVAAVRDRVMDWARKDSSAHESKAPRREHSPSPLLRFDSPPSAASFNISAEPPTGLASEGQTPVHDLGPSPTSSHSLQAHNRYLVTSSDEGLIVIDQHALHERILYEQFRERVLAGDVETQRLLTPLPVDLSPTEAAVVLENQQTLAEMGVEIEAFGGSTVLVQGYPAMLGKADPAELVRQLAAQLVQERRSPDRRDVLDELLHMMSCKAAIKAGDSLSQSEVNALVEYRHLVQDAHHCPHGRPTTLIFTKEELDRRFRRI